MLAGGRAVAGKDVGAGSTSAILARLERAGEALGARTTDEIVAALDRACSRWRDAGDADRRTGVTALCEHYRVPAPAIAEILDAAFGHWTGEALRKWIRLELGHPSSLDGFVSSGSVRRRALGPRLVAVVSAHGVPTTPVADLLAALSVKAAVWLKPAAGTDDLAARFAATVADCDPALGAAIEVSPWRPGSETEGAVLTAADTVVATGSVGTLEALRAAIPGDTRLIVHGPRLSAAIVTREALAGDPEGMIRALARDTAFAGQMGCLSPSVAYIESGAGAAGELAERIQAACSERWPCPPRIADDAAQRAAFAEWAARADVEAAAGAAGVWAGGADKAWSCQVRTRAEPPEPPAVPRLLFLAPIGDAGEAAALCARRRGQVATVGIAAPPERAASLARALAAAGVERIAPLGAMQSPPLTWRRDGRPTLGDLVRWVDWEG